MDSKIIELVKNGLIKPRIGKRIHLLVFGRVLI